MSYSVESDGVVTFRCQGKDCGKTKSGRGLKILPKGWFVTGILMSQASEEFREGGKPAMDADRLTQANEDLSGHFCSFKCAKRTFEDPRVVACVRNHRVAVVVYGACKMVIDASGHADEEGDEPARPRGGSRDDEPGGGDVKPKGLNDPKSPPPFKLPPDAGGGF
jgi:hypothetical protein